MPYHLEMMNWTLVGLIHITDTTDKKVMEEIREEREILSLHGLQKCGRNMNLSVEGIYYPLLLFLMLSVVTESLKAALMFSSNGWIYRVTSDTQLLLYNVNDQVSHVVILD